jgi:NADH dehydrogenase FAD-containing subunit
MYLDGCGSSFSNSSKFLNTHQPTTQNNTDAKMTIPDEVDIIVVGGGSCGCVVAGRLANLDHNLQVMLIEAGESNLNVRLSRQYAVEDVV